MKVFLKVIIFSLIIIWWLYFLAPQIFKEDIGLYNEKIDIKKYTLTPNIWKVYLLNLELLSLKDFTLNNISSNTKLYFDAVDIFNTNVIELLDNNEDKKLVLNTYILQLKHIQSKLENEINNIQNTNSEEQTKAQTYLQEKKRWDDNFIQGFKTKDSELVEKGVKKSYENWPLYIKHRILSNAGKILLHKLTTIKSLIDAKLNLLENNDDMIISHYDEIKWNLLWKLIKLKKKLELNKYN